MDPEENINIVVKRNSMDINDANKGLDDLVNLANSTSVTMTLNQMSQYISLYHARRDDESLIKMNYTMLILLIKQGLFDIEQTRKDMSVVIKQRELLQIIQDFKS